jgi:NADPH:quinone reductase-like Zn-dependent oxidoreductase
MVTAAKLCAPLNKNVPIDMGAMLLVNPLTALAFLEIAKQNNHHAIVSTAAASALGGMLLSLGNRAKIPIIHIVRRPAQVALVKSRGGEYVLNSNEAGFTENLRELVHTLQASLILDAIGGRMTQQLVEAALQESTLLLYGRLSHEDIQIDPRVAVHKDLTMRGWYLANWIRNKNLLQVLRMTQQAQKLVTTQYKVPVYKRLPLADAESGINQYIQNMTAGKIILVANPQLIDLDQ